MRLPTIHTNGTSPECLRDGYLDARQAVLHAQVMLGKIELNGRDYYLQEPGAFGQAVREQSARDTKLRELADELLAIAEHCQSAIDERNARLSETAPR